ncbi:RNA-binding protein Sap49 [Schizosaccharomyces cryophilus OY26]|uniref:Splicing factor 3B subunit 4 n=1 Tax=Schizosaccharomyces cryophilus (strain OY26 / ATCC MYA-4695 / CBS 11777 / NBRC 106824 / NRRL Y48691) TaxID=653667 RepID=S9W430_SCHCR|nr:RNA-binding protein Sap49 [Schizosaccharomyces cryophilus OY26]EPY53304.1 RNA-binding protein Sap49 [Schizosaccharomyces cryophilus OY26]
MAAREEKNQEATIYLGNLDERVTDSILFELCLQAGPVGNIHIPRDRVRNSHNGFGFCEFVNERDAEYACQIFNQIKLYGKPLRINKSSQDKNVGSLVGANLFIGNLDPLVDERVLYDTFSALGQLIKAPQIVRDENGRSKGYGFVNFDSFDTADAAIEAMNNQFLMNKPITVSYAYKREGKGERHGDLAERKLAAAAKKNKVAITPQATLPPGFTAAPPSTTASSGTVTPNIAPTPIPPLPVMGATANAASAPLPNLMPFATPQVYSPMPNMAPMMNMPFNPPGSAMIPPPPPPGMVMNAPPSTVSIPGMVPMPAYQVPSQTNQPNR